MPTRALNALHVIDTLGLGGAQTLIRDVLAVPAPGVRHSVFALRQRESQIELPADRAWVHPSASKWSMAPLRELCERIAQMEVDIVHYHLPRSELFGALLRGRVSRRIGLVAHEHGQILGSDDGRRLTHWGYCAFKRATVSRFDRHIAVSGAVARRLVKVTGIDADRAVTLHNFIDATRFAVQSDVRAARRRALGIAPDARIVGFAGRLIRRKGWLELLEAFAILKRRGVSAQLLVAGNGPDRELMLARIATLGLSNDVHYLGIEKDMPGFYATVDCVAMPSRFEALGQVQLEAMAMGVPLVLANAPGANEVARPDIDALYVPINDAAALADAIARLLSDAALAQRLCGNAAQRVADFSSARYVAALEDIYRGVLHE